MKRKTDQAAEPSGVGAGGAPGRGRAARRTPGETFSIPSDIKYLDPEQLESLAEAFRKWRAASPRAATRRARGRIWLIFLLLRYAGARLGEVLSLDDREDFDIERGMVSFGKRTEGVAREVQLPEDVVRELRLFLEDPANQSLRGTVFQVDQGFLRRKFYERAGEAGLPRDLTNPNTLRKSRAIELLRNNVPLPVVQSMLGHSTSTQTASYIDYSDSDIRDILGQFIQREAKFKTSARNAFHGKVTGIKRGDIQAEVEVTTAHGTKVYAVITIDSLETLELSIGKLVTAVIKAPWVVLSRADGQPKASARNTYLGRVIQMKPGRIASEALVELPDGTVICSIVTGASAESLHLKVGDPAWVMCSDFAVILDLP